MRTKYFAILECDPSTHSRIMGRTEKHLAIGFVLCPVFDYVPVLRCFRCCLFGHVASKCQGEEVCGKCMSREHSTGDCISDVNRCVNCATANSKYNLQLNDRHTVFDSKCPTYEKMVSQVKLGIEYFSSNQ